MFRKINNDGDKQHLQNDLDKLVKLSEKWQMLFNFGKCICLHAGHGNLDVNYKMGDTVLGTTVVPAFNGHFCIQAKVSLHSRCPIIGGTGMLEWRVQYYTYMVDICADDRCYQLT